MGELIIGWTKRARTEQSVASECILTQIWMALTSLSAMQLHNDTKKPWPEMVAGEVEQMNTELVCPRINKLSKVFCVSAMTIKTECKKKRKKCCYGNMWYRKLKRREKKQMQHTDIYRVVRTVLLNSCKNLEDDTQTHVLMTICEADSKTQKAELLHCHHLSSKHQRNEDAMG